MQYSVNSILHDEDGGRGFIGVSGEKTDEGRTIVTPYGFVCPQVIDSLDKPNVDRLKRYVKAVQKAIQGRTREGVTTVKGLDNPLAAMNIIHDYLSMGRYIEYESYRTVSKRGKINFKQTVKRIRPTIVDDRFFYDTFVTDRKRTLENSLLARVQGNIINDFMTNGGDILFGQALRVTVEPLNLKDARLLMLLHEERNNSFNSRKLNLLRWSEEYIKSVLNPDNAIRGEWNYAIKAYTFWETIVNFAYGNQDPREKKSKYGTTYNSKNIIDPKKNLSGDPTEHDTIFEDNDYIFIIDSKMYDEKKHLLSEANLGKQFGYYLSAKDNQLNKKVVNILCIPWIGEKGWDKGFQYDIILDPHDPDADPDKIIFIYACPVNDLVDDYYYGRKRTGAIREEFEAFTRQPAVRAWLDSRRTSF